MNHQTKSPSEILLQSKLQPSENPGQFEVVIQKKAQVELKGLTMLEIAYLQRHHRSRKVNTERAMRVKAYRANGCTLKEIAAFLKGEKGRGRRMIATDLAALSEAERKTRKM